MECTIADFLFTEAYTKDVKEHIFDLNSLNYFILYPGILQVQKGADNTC